MALRNCSECGNEISSKAQQCSKCGIEREHFRFFGISRHTAFVGFLVLVILGGILSGKFKTASTTTPSPPVSRISIPREQSNFTGIVDSFVSRYQEAPNELKKSELRRQRANALADVFGTTLGGTGITDWMGSINRMGTNHSGKAYVQIMLLHSNASVVASSIPMDSSVYKNLSEMAKGDVVIFSGELSSAGGTDHFGEISVTEQGSMTNPEFVFRLSNVSKYYH